MGWCFPCFGSSNKEEKELSKKDSTKDGSVGQSHHVNRVSSEKSKSRSVSDPKKEPAVPKDGSTANIAAQTFTFRELAVATKNFRPECLLGEGGFGRVYKGRLESTGQVVAVKQLDRNGLQGNREFLVEVLMLSLLNHPNLVNLIGYCADGDQRLLVNEFMPLGSLEDHLHDLPPDREPLDWNTRMKIAAGAAKGLEYLHDKANPPVIYGDLKSSNILLDEGYHPKISDFGLAKLGPVGDKTHVSTRVMGTYDYYAPEYAMTGQLTLKSDVYSFGVVFLGLITGRKAIDIARAPGEHNLVAWARPLFKDRRKFPEMADPLLRGCYPMRGLYQALAVAAMCLQEQAAMRPLIGDVVTALTYLASQTYDPNAPSNQSNIVGPSNPILKDDRRRMADGLDSPYDESSPKKPDTRTTSRRLTPLAITHLLFSRNRSGRCPYCWVFQPIFQYLADMAAKSKLTLFSLQRVWKSKENLPAWSRIYRRFKLQDLLKATNNFDPACIIAEDGSYSLYKGHINDYGKYPIVIKRFKSSTNYGRFLNEMELLSSVDHPNIVSPAGYCLDESHQHMIIVYNHMAQGTLQDHLQSTNGESPLPWKRRLQICIGAARGLEYLHSSNPLIINRDIKSKNIHLDKYWGAKILDFSLSKSIPSNQLECYDDHITTDIAGTIGYLDPENMRKFGELTTESDVYSFGVVLFEVLCGRKHMDFSLPEKQVSLSEWSRQCIEDGRLDEIIDPPLKGEIPSDCLKAYANLAYNCSNEHSNQIPTVTTVLKRLQLVLLLQECVEADIPFSPSWLRYIMPSQKMSQSVTEIQDSEIISESDLEDLIR